MTSSALCILMGKALRWFGYGYHCQLRLSEPRHRPRPNVVDQLRASDTWPSAKTPEPYHKMIEQSCSCFCKNGVAAVAREANFGDYSTLLDLFFSV